MSGIKLALVTSGDPRRPDEVHTYKPPPHDPDKDVSPLLVIASLVGLVGLWMRMRWVSWLGVFLTLSAYATVRQSFMDTKQLVFSAVFAVMGLGSIYLLPAARFFGRSASTAAGAPTPTAS